MDRRDATRALVGLAVGPALLEPLIGRASGRTRVLVSHDVQGALAESDGVLRLKRGRPVGRVPGAQLRHRGVRPGAVQPEGVGRGEGLVRGRVALGHQTERVAHACVRGGRPDGVLDRHEDTAWGVLQGFSESAENQAQTAALVGNGVAYVPYG